MKKRIIICVLVLMLVATALLSGCGEESVQLKTESESFVSLVDEGRVDELKLTVYYIDPTILTAIPLSVDRLINDSTVSKIEIEGSELAKHVDLFKRFKDVELKPVGKETCLNCRYYYVFETEKGKMLDVAMWGEKGSVFVNGVNVEWNEIFYDMMVPFLTEDAKSALDSYLGK